MSKLKNAFIAALMRIKNLDQDELVTGGVFDRGDVVLYAKFQKDPIAFFLECPPEMSDAIWRLL